MTLLAYSKNQDLESWSSSYSANCPACAEFHAEQERKQGYDSKHNRYKNDYKTRFKEQLLQTRTQKLMQEIGHTPECTCECHNLNLKKPTVDVPLPFDEAKKGLGRDPTFEEKAKEYFSTEGKQLTDYLQKEGREFYKLEAIGTYNLERAIAAVAIEGDKAILAGSKNFENRVNDLAKWYGVNQDIARRYVFDHETTHLSQKGKYFDDHGFENEIIQAENDVEATLSEFYGKMLRKTGKPEYKALEKIANDRLANVKVNYATNKN